MPATLREIFSTLEQHGSISAHSAVHDYQALSKPILKAILVSHLQDLEEFYAQILAGIPPNTS
jgi:uncharacterized protein YutE (UPF0331/DUF86 family)